MDDGVQPSKAKIIDEHDSANTQDRQPVGCRGRADRPQAHRFFPDQLKPRISVIPPAMQVFAASMTILVLAALVWAVFGSVPTLVAGRGVVLADVEGNFAIAAVSTGPVLEILVKPGDRVAAGAPIATIEQKLLSVRFENAVAEIERLEDNLTLLKAAHAKQIEDSDENSKRQQAAIDEQVAANTVRRERLSQLVAGYKTLRGKGMISENQIIAKQEQYDQITLSLANAAASKIGGTGRRDETRRSGRNRAPEAGGNRSQEGRDRPDPGGAGGRNERHRADQRRHSRGPHRPR